MENSKKGGTVKYPYIAGIWIFSLQTFVAIQQLFSILKMRPALRHYNTSLFTSSEEGHTLMTLLLYIHEESFDMKSGFHLVIMQKCACISSKG